MRKLSFLVLLAAGCSSSPSKSHDGGAADMAMAAADMTTNPLILARPYQVDVPTGSDPTKPLPLIVLLHGYGADGLEQDSYFDFTTLANAHQVYVAHPDGTVDSTGSRFWNATDACCDEDHTGVDDVAYLNAVVDDVEEHYAVDTKRVFFVGHSNGGFMSHRMACDNAGRVAAIAALAGDNWKDPSKCNPSEPVAALQIHGDADATIPYDGDGMLIPSAMDSIGVWAMKNGCTGGLVDTGMTYDVDTTLAGNETTGAAWSCPAGAAELWTIHGGAHIPALNTPMWGEYLYAWLMAHAKN